MQHVGVHGAHLGDQLEQPGEPGAGGAEEAGVRHKDVDGDGDTGDGGLGTSAGDYVFEKYIKKYTDLLKGRKVNIQRYNKGLKVYTSKKTIIIFSY